MDIVDLIFAAGRAEQRLKAARAAAAAAAQQRRRVEENDKQWDRSHCYGCGSPYGGFSGASCPDCGYA